MLASLLAIVLLLSMVWSVEASKVAIEYFYWTESSCPECPPCPEEINELIRDIEIEYQDQVFVERYDILNWADPRLPDVLEKYNFTDFPAVVVNQEYKVEGEENIDGNELRMVIEAYLSNGEPGIDKTPPSIGHPFHEPQQVMPNQEVTISVNVSDTQSNVKNVVLSYNTDSGTSWMNVTMSLDAEGLYVGEIVGFEAETEVFYKIIAYDEAGNSASTSMMNYTVEAETSVLGMPVERLVGVIIIIAVLCGAAIYIIKFGGK